MTSTSPPRRPPILSVVKHDLESAIRRPRGADSSERVVALLAAPGLVALTADPAIWLWRTWHDPSYQSDGALVAVVAAGLVVLSLASGPAAPDPRARRRAAYLLAATAAVRLAGRVLAVNTLGALALVIDVAGEEFMQSMTTGVLQDLAIWKNKVHRARPVLCEGDSYIAQFRQWARQFYSRPVE